MNKLRFWAEELVNNCKYSFETNLDIFAIK